MGKTDKDLYRAMVTEKSTVVYEKNANNNNQFTGSNNSSKHTAHIRRPNMLRSQSYLSGITQTKGMEC